MSQSSSVPASAAAADARAAQLQAWLAQQAGIAPQALVPASSDASFRRYYRIRGDSGSLIVMDAPPPQEDCRPFVQVAGLMRAAGLHVPEILAQDLQRGFLLLSDLGTQTYLSVITGGNADELFADAVTALLRWQLASREDVLPAYDAALLRRELALFPDWYLGRHLGVTLTAAERELLAGAEELLLQSALAQPRVYVHRDYMPRNLMLSEPNPGVLDFQDAVHGPITYDLASLFKDAFLSWPEERVLAWQRRYWEQARAAGLPVAGDVADFRRQFDWMGLQRHLKVLGIFARINYRDGKPGYLADTPRFVRYVMDTALRYSELAPLVTLFERHVLPAQRDA